MEKPVPPKEPTNQTTIEVSVELLQNLRNILEVTNARIRWKTEELLPVGQTIKQLDDVILQGKPKHSV
jgi:hypothetical protein